MKIKTKLEKLTMRRDAIWRLLQVVRKNRNCTLENQFRSLLRKANREIDTEKEKGKASDVVWKRFGKV